MAFAGNLVVNLTAKTDKFRSSMDKARRKTKQAADDMKRLGNQIAAATGIAMAAGSAIAVRKLAEFDDAIRATGAIASATDAEFAALESRALQLGKTTSFTAAEVAGLMTELARGGIKPTEINKMTQAVLNLSRATGTEAAMSAEIMATTLNQFSLGAKDATHVADVFTTAANSTLNTVEKLGEAMKFAAPVAQDLGMSLEDTTAIVATLGNVGIQGTMAGAAIRRLGAVTGAEAERMEKVFGIAFRDSAGEILPLIDMLENVNKATAGLTRGGRMAKMKEAFGLLGITAAASLGKAAGSAKDLADKLRNISTTSAETAEKMDAGIGGSLRKMMSAVDGLAIAFGKSLEPVVTKITAVIQSAALNMDKWLGIAIKMTAAVVAVAAAFKVVAAATRAYTIAMIFAQGISGPAGWANLAIGIAAAGTAMLAVDAAMGDVGATATKTATEVESAAVRMATAAELEEFEHGPFTDSADRFTDAYTDMLPPIKAVQAALATPQGAEEWNKQAEQLEALKNKMQELNAQFTQVDGLEEFTSLVDKFVIAGERDSIIDKFINQESGFNEALRSAQDEFAMLQGSVTETSLLLHKLGEQGVSTEKLEQLRAVLEDIDAEEKRQAKPPKRLTDSFQKGSKEALTQILTAGMDSKKSPQVKEQKETNTILRGMAAVLERQRERNAKIQGRVA